MVGWMPKCCKECLNLTIRYWGGLYHLFQIGVFFTFFKVRKYSNFVKVIADMVTL